MIRINLLGQARPKPARRAMPLESTLQLLFLLGALAVATGYLLFDYYRTGRNIDSTRAETARLEREKADLQQIKAQVTEYENQMNILQQRITIIEELKGQRTGGQELLQTIANTVIRVDALWLTNLARKGNDVTIQGEAGSINAVANYITQLKRSGYFDRIEIKEAKESDLLPGTPTFDFVLSAAVSASAPGTTAAAAPAGGAPPQPAKKG